jgi:hypothetical protein
MSDNTADRWWSAEEVETAHVWGSTPDSLPAGKACVALTSLLAIGGHLELLATIVDDETAARGHSCPRERVEDYLNNPTTRRELDAAIKASGADGHRFATRPAVSRQTRAALAQARRIREAREPVGPFTKASA